MRCEMSDRINEFICFVWFLVDWFSIKRNKYFSLQCIAPPDFTEYKTAKQNHQAPCVRWFTIFDAYSTSARCEPKQSLGPVASTYYTLKIIHCLVHYL